MSVIHKFHYNKIEIYNNKSIEEELQKVKILLNNLPNRYSNIILNQSRHVNVPDLMISKCMLKQQFNSSFGEECCICILLAST